MFRRAVQRYGRTPEPVTPYQRAAQVWDDRIGSARVQARSWRLMAFGSLLLSAGLAGGLLWQSLQTRVRPYVVEVDRLGQAIAIAPADADFEPSDPQMAWHLAHFIENVRSIPLDPVLMRRNWLSAYDFTTERGAKFLNGYAREAQPFVSVGDRTVSVQVTSVVRASDRSFQVKWSETAYERGSAIATERWTAILSVTLRAPPNADVLRKNPLGLYVDGIDWSRELEPPAVPTPSPKTPQLPSVPQGSPLDPPDEPGGPALPRENEETRT